MPELFSLNEANQALQTVRPLMDEIQAIRQNILAKQPEAWPAVEKSAGNGGNRALSQLVLEFEKLDALIHKIQDLGVLIKDINTGLQISGLAHILSISGLQTVPEPAPSQQCFHDIASIVDRPRLQAGQY